MFRRRMLRPAVEGLVFQLQQARELRQVRVVGQPITKQKPENHILLSAPVYQLKQYGRPKRKHSSNDDILCEGLPPLKPFVPKVVEQPLTDCLINVVDGNKQLPIRASRRVDVEQLVIFDCNVNYTDK